MNISFVSVILNHGYIDDIFFTSNESEEQVKKLLDAANKHHPNIKLEYHIGKTLPFLDVLITNNNGTISSSIYHKPSAEPAVVSFLSDHPRHVFRNVVQTALARAVRYSSTLEAFNHERRNIRLMLLYNKYPIAYIDEQFRRFFVDYMSSSSSLPLIDDENQFFLLREKLLKQPTAKQTQVANSAATVTILNDDRNAQNVQQSMNKIIIQTNNNKFKNNLFIHYTHEARFEGMAREIHMIHDTFFKHTHKQSIRLIVGYRNNPNMEYELAKKRPSSTLLKDPLKKKPKPNEIQSTS